MQDNILNKLKHEVNLQIMNWPDNQDREEYFFNDSALSAHEVTAFIDHCIALCNHNIKIIGIHANLSAMQKIFGNQDLMAEEYKGITIQYGSKLTIYNKVIVVFEKTKKEK